MKHLAKKIVVIVDGKKVGTIDTSKISKKKRKSKLKIRKRNA